MSDNVDNIITDDIRLANRIVGKSYTGTALQGYICWLRKNAGATFPSGSL